MSGDTGPNYNIDGGTYDIDTYNTTDLGNGTQTFELVLFSGNTSLFNENNFFKVSDLNTSDESTYEIKTVSDITSNTVNLVVTLLTGNDVDWSNKVVNIAFAQ